MMDLDIRFEHDMYEYDEVENKKVVYYQQSWIKRHGAKIYKNKIYTAGKDIDKIREVKYILHSTFPNPIRTFKNRDKNFEMTFWAWAGFTMRIIVTDIEGEHHNYDRYIGLFDIVQQAEKQNLLKEYEVPQINIR